MLLTGIGDDYDNADDLPQASSRGAQDEIPTMFVDSINTFYDCAWPIMRQAPWRQVITINAMPFVDGFHA